MTVGRLDVNHSLCQLQTQAEHRHRQNINIGGVVGFKVAKMVASDSNLAKLYQLWHNGGERCISVL